MQECHRAILRNINYCSRCILGQRAAPRAATDGEAELVDGTILDPPGEDETAPEAPERPISHCPRLCSEGFTAPSAENAGGPPALPKAQTPKQSRTANKDEGFMKLHCETFRYAALSF